MDTPKQSPVDVLLAEIVIAMHQWSEKQTQTIGAAVHARLDQHRDEVLRKLMGFSTSHNGRWEIDHCNGRNGESAISTFLKESQEAAIKEWLSQIKLPEMTPKFKARIEKNLRDTYEREIQSKTYSMAVARAQKDLDSLLGNVLKPTLVDKYLQLQKLVDPPQPIPT